MRDSQERMLAAVGLSNLLLIMLWSSLLSPMGKHGYLLKHPPSAVHYWCALAATVLLAALFAGWIAVVERTSGGVQRALMWLFLMTLPVAANSVRDVLSLAFPLLKGELLRVVPGWLVAGVAAGVVAAYAAGSLRWTERWYRAALTLLMVISPAILVSGGQGLYRALKPPLIHADLQPAARAKGMAKTRVVWVIFDELDQRILFEDRPANLRLPEFDRLRRTALYATQTYSPSSSTLTAIPSLLAGRMIENAEPRDDSTLMVRFSGDGGKPARWNGNMTVLADMRALGLNSGLAGWYHPYCRVMGDQVTRCAWEEMPFKLTSYGESWTEVLPNELRGLFETSLMSAFGQSLVTKQAVRNFQHLEKEALEMAADPGLGFCFLHLQPAHAPFIYRRRDDSFELRNSTVSGYYDALALADRTLRRLREAMVRGGVWDKTHLVVSSDHHYRTARMLDGKPGTRVPFLVRVAGDEEAVEYRGRVESVITRALVSRLVSGEIRTAREVVGWLDQTMAKRR